MHVLTINGAVAGRKCTPKKREITNSTSFMVQLFHYESQSARIFHLLDSMFRFPFGVKRVKEGRIISNTWTSICHLYTRQRVISMMDCRASSRAFSFHLFHIFHDANDFSCVSLVCHAIHHGATTLWLWLWDLGLLIKSITYVLRSTLL